MGLSAPPLTAAEVPANGPATWEAPADQPDAGLASRDAALEALAAVLRRRRPLDESLDRAAVRAGLDGRDRALALRLAAATLRRLGEIDALIDRCLNEPLPDRAAPTRDILRLGACQLVFLDTPPHAAVDTAVTLARRHRQGRYLKLVNAVLRRIGREGVGLIAGGDPIALNTPAWLLGSWTASFGAEVAREIAQTHLVEPPLDLTPHPRLGDPAALAARLGARVLPTGSVRLDRAGAVGELPGYAEGAWWVQDAAAALPVRLFGDLAGARVADLCAAPGGKTAQLAALGARVTAVDRSAARLDRLKENLDRLGLRAEAVVADAAGWQPEEAVDAVLLDAPCSATGTIRRHPDIARIKRPEDVAALAATQRRLLAATAGMVRPGGVVVYCVCSLEAEEGPAHLAAIAAGGLPFDAVPVAADESLAPFADAAGAVRTLPSRWRDLGGIDGFYALRLRRR